MKLNKIGGTVLLVWIMIMASEWITNFKYKTYLSSGLFILGAALTIVPLFKRRRTK